MPQRRNRRNGMIATVLVLMLITAAPVLAFLNDSSGSSVRDLPGRGLMPPDRDAPSLPPFTDTREQHPSGNGTMNGSDAVVGKETVSVNPKTTASPSCNVSGNGSIRMPVPEQVERPAKPEEEDTGWRAQYARYPELTELREHSVKHFDLGNGNRVAIVSGGLLHYYDGEKFEEIPELPFPEGMIIENPSETHVLTFPDWCTVRVDEDGAVVRAYDAKGVEIYTFMHPFIVAKGVSPYKPANLRSGAADIATADDEPEGGLSILDEDAITHCTFAVQGNSLHLVLPHGTSYPVQAYDDTALGTNNKDAYIAKNNPNVNYGTDATLRVRAGRSNRIQRIVMGWTMPDGTGTITGVNLSLYKHYNETSNNFNVEVHEILETSFVESQVTWNSKATGDAWDGGAGCEPPSSNSTIVDSIPRTTSVNEWHTWWLLGGLADNSMDLTWNKAFEILLKESTTFTSSTEEERFRSKEYTNVSQRPYLTITYEPDTEPPEWSDPQTNKTTIYQGDSVRFAANWSDVGGLAGYIFSINQTGSWINSSFVPFSGTANTSENVTLITAAAGTTVQWRFYANDTSDNWNVTAVQSFIVQEADTEPPAWSDPQTNKTTIYQGDSVRFAANWSDAGGLAGYIFSINQTGSWLNSSFVPFSGTANTSENVTVITAAAGTTVQWRFYANDTADNWNATSVQSFIVQSSEHPAPSTPFVIYGWVQYENGSACTDPQVNLTNLDTSVTWQAETNLSSHYYQLILANGSDVHAGDVLQFVARDPQGLRVTVVEHSIIGSEVTTGGIFNLNITLLAPVTPFFMYGWVVYESGSPCNNPAVNITNTNTSISWMAETRSGSHYYQLILDTANVSAQDNLAFNASDGTQYNLTNHTVTPSELENGGLFAFNLTLPTSSTAPVVESITITPDDDAYSEGVQIAPNPGDNKTVTISAVVHDSSGYADISTVVAIISGPSSVPESPVTLSFVANSTPTTATYTGTFNLSFYNLSGTYTVSVTATDTSSQTGSKDDTCEYQTARALELDTGTISFGAIDPGSTSEVLGDEDMGTLSNATVRNIGNVVLDLEVSGTNLTANGNTITKANIQARLDALSYLDLGATRTFDIDLPVGPLSLENADFKLAVPLGTPGGTYSGSVTISAAAP